MHGIDQSRKEDIMTTFDTPEPIAAEIALGHVASNIWIVASDRSDTVVGVRPTNGARDSDIKAAEQTSVEYSNGRLRILTPKSWKDYTFLGGKGSVDVTIELPTASEVHGESGLGELRCAGVLGNCTLKSGAGDILVDEASGVRLDTGMGDVTVNRARGDLDATTGSGQLRIHAVDGTAVLKNSNGHTTVGNVTGDLRVKAANGDITIDRAESSVTAKTANGKVRIGDVARGSIVLESAAGALEIGIHEGSAAWLDLSSKYGTVHNSLAAAGGPEETDESVEVRARTSFGNITIRRAARTSS
jgi:DUF4097 and DUF4098 domain-containing protein YvlB